MLRSLDVLRAPVEVELGELELVRKASAGDLQKEAEICVKNCVTLKLLRHFFVP